MFKLYNLMIVVLVGWFIWYANTDSSTDGKTLEQLFEEHEEMPEVSIKSCFGPYIIRKHYNWSDGDFYITECMSLNADDITKPKDEINEKPDDES